MALRDQAAFISRAIGGNLRRTLAVAFLLFLGLFLLLGVDGARAAELECNSKQMNVVAHEDDTLLFQSPSLVQSIESGRCVRTVFLTAGDAGKGASYWGSREEGAEAAYAQMAGVEDEWSASTVSAAGHSLVLRTLIADPRVSLVFMRLPDGGYPGGTGYPLYGNQSLMKLWNGGNKATPSETTISSDDGANSFDYQGLISTLTALFQAFEPQLIATQNFNETFAGEDHRDHVATAYFTRLAQKSYAASHQLVGYEDYNSSSRPQNVFGAPLEFKSAVFYTYGLYDEGACSEEVTCASLEYANWLKRQYVVGTETTGVVANAGYTQSVEPGSSVTLDGSASSDQSGHQLGYRWTQTGGPAVSLSSTQTAKPSFLAPSGTASLTFSLTVLDGITASKADTVTIQVGGANQPPVAAAGAPQTVTSGAAVQLDGSASTDPEGQPLTYSWTQTGGPLVTLAAASSAKPTFTAPAGPATLIFSLVVSDGSQTSQPATVAVEVLAAAEAANVAPLATATASSEAEGQGPSKAIDGIVSGYPANPFAEWSSNGGKAGTWLNLKWSKSYLLDHVVLYDRPNTDDQITAGTLTFSDGSTVSFGALPNNGATGLTVSFSPRATTSLKVTATAVSSTTVNVGLAEVEAWGTSVNPVPVAAAGAPQTVTSGAAVQLDGSASTDPEGQPLTYSWTQTGGPLVTLAAASSAKPTFTAPAGPATLIFSLVVSDGSQTSQPATVAVEVLAAAEAANVAPLATATASSEAEGQGPSKAIDGIVSGYPANPFAEWSSNGGKAGTWLNLKWSKSYLLDHVVLYDRPNTDDQITAGTLTFSDGSTVSFGALPNNGATGLTVSFSPRATTSLKVTATAVSSTTVNVGLAEVEAWGTGAPIALGPSITSAAASSFTTGTAGSFTVLSTGEPAATLKATGTLPAGLSFVDHGDGTGAIAGTAAASAAPAGSSQTYPLTITATNSAGTASQNLTLTVVNNEPKPTAPTFTSAASTSFTTGTAGTFSVVSAGVPTATLKSSGTLPSGVTFVANSNGTATLAGTPAASAAPAGSSKAYPLTFTATNSSGSKTQTFSLKVVNNEPKPTAPTFTSAASTSFTTGTAGTFSVVSAGVPTATLKSSGTLPSGVTFVANSNGTATLAGTPAASAAPAGSSKAYPLTFTATNSSGSKTQTFSLKVVNNESKPVFTTPSSRTGTVGKELNIPIEASGVPAPTLSLSGSPPKGLTFTATTAGKATLTGTPTSAATTKLTLTAKNSAGTTTQTLTLTISR